ncbi:hypothetical protein SMU26_02630 [Streptococcus mutans 3SN1]|uniref:hypothetical protein n=1 Tax=Streptococcus mutans TaxID=1309 RepID=UPI0002B4F5B0|nr:hypothetical protein [Streptococcus mutans]EMB67378.1 hypothetical protein SMU26_02630 [Streptococcus mutans 3SN1]
MGNFLAKLFNRNQETKEEVSLGASIEEAESFYSDELIHFYKLDTYTWYGAPKSVFSFRDFNFHEKILNYLDSVEIGAANATTFYSSFKSPSFESNCVICELKLYLETPKDSDYHFKFAKESNEIFVKGDGGVTGINHLVNSLKYVILNDADFKNKSIQFNSEVIYLPENREKDLSNLKKELIEEEIFINSMNRKNFRDSRKEK